MSNRSASISHNGVVMSIQEKQLTVKLDVQAACKSCTVAGVCGAAKLENKVVTAAVNGSLPVHIGDTVRVMMASRLGYWAIFYTYILPFSLLLTALLAVSGLGFPDVTAALGSMAVLFPYYFILYLLRGKMKRVFFFTAEPLPA